MLFNSNGSCKLKKRSLSQSSGSSTLKVFSISVLLILMYHFMFSWKGLKVAVKNLEKVVASLWLFTKVPEGASLNMSKDLYNSTAQIYSSTHHSTAVFNSHLVFIPLLLTKNSCILKLVYAEPTKCSWVTV